MEQKKITGSKSSYYSKSEKRNIERTSKKVNLGVNSAFDVGDVAYVLSETEYNDLIKLTNTDATKEITKLNETIKELNNKLNSLTNDNETLNNANKDLSVINSNLEKEISQLKDLIYNKDKELTKYNAIDVDKLQQLTTELETTNKELNTEIKTKTDYIVYMEQMQTDFVKLLSYYNDYFKTYKNRNILKRIANTDVNSDIDKPMLKHLDLKGNPINKEDAPTIPIAKTDNAKSE